MRVARVFICRTSPVYAGFKLNKISDFDAPFEQQNDASNQIAENCLKTEANTDTNGAREYGKTL